jgi:integrase
MSSLRKLVALANVPTMDQITTKHVRDLFSTFTRNKGQTVNKKRGHISDWFSWAIPLKYVAENVAAPIKKSKTDPFDGDVYSKSELETLFRNIRSRSFEKPVLMAFWIGLDRSDLEKLQGEEIDRINRRITGYRSKTGKRREQVPIFDQVLPVLNTLPRSGLVFGEWKSLECVAGKANDAGIDFRKLRRSYVSHLLANGVDLVVVSRWAVHDPATDIRHYAKPTGEPMRFTYRGKPLESWGLPNIRSKAKR